MRRAALALGAPARGAARREAYGTFDAIKSWLGGGDGAAAPREGEDLSIRDYVSILERAEIERASASEDARAKSPAEISFPASRARAYVDAMTARELEDPGAMPARRRRELGARAEVDELLKAHALTRAIARRTKAMTTTPTSPEALAEALRDGDEKMSTAQRRSEAAAMRGAFPSNRPCPCGSNKKFKRCCGLQTS
jgi:hypothetical protein